MQYEGNIFRPPAEHNSIILQVTTGCSHNACGFCGLYKDKKFTIKSTEQIINDLKYAQVYYPNTKRVFLCDGDALIIPTEKLIEILDNIILYLPWITRVGTYANAKSILRKTPEELETLKKKKLGILYLGLESGDNNVLHRMNKGVCVEEQIEAGRRVKSAGMKLSCTVILGLGGKSGSKDHALLTASALSKIDPNYANALSLMIDPCMPLYSDISSGIFIHPDPMEILAELRILIENLHLSGGIFSANHASNYLPIQIRIPGGKDEALKMIDAVLNGNISIKPEWMRAL